VFDQMTKGREEDRARRLSVCFLVSVTTHALSCAVLAGTMKAPQRHLQAESLTEVTFVSRSGSVRPPPPAALAHQEPSRSPLKVSPKRLIQVAMVQPKPIPQDEKLPVSRPTPESPPVADEEAVRPPKPDAEAGDGEDGATVDGKPGGVPGGVSGGVVGGLAGASTAEPVIGPSYGAAYLRNPVPEYPAAARRLGLEGTAVVRVLVGEDGRPKNAAIEKSSGVRVLDEAALAAVQRWFFVPARRGSTPISAEVDVPVRFRLGGASTVAPEA
jgi:periplasmic protein TonB